MQGEEGFRRMRDLLVEHGFEELEASYAGETFGSWHVTLAGSPRIRVVWDGKEAQARIEAELPDVPKWPGYDSPWHNVWVANRPEEATADRLLRAAETLRYFASEAAQH